MAMKGWSGNSRGSVAARARTVVTDPMIQTATQDRKVAAIVMALDKWKKLANAGNGRNVTICETDLTKSVSSAKKMTWFLFGQSGKS